MDIPRQRLAPVVGGMIEKAKANGDLRQDFDVLDVPLIEIMLARLNDLTGQVDPDLWLRMLTLVFDGMRADGKGLSPMPAEPISPVDYVTVISTPER
jgi:hypothetical protein